MNTALVLVICAIGLVQAAMLTEEQKQKVMDYATECMKESKADMDMVMATTKGVYADDPKLKAQILCFNKKIGIQAPNGDLVMDVIKTRVTLFTKDDKKTDEVIKKCVIKKATPEDTAFESSKCLHKLLPNENIFE